MPQREHSKRLPLRSKPRRRPQDQRERVHRMSQGSRLGLISSEGAEYEEGKEVKGEGEGGGGG